MTEIPPEIIGMGIEGKIISTLMSVIVVLASVIAYQHRQANKIYGYRLRERDTLNKALSDSSAAQTALIKANEEHSDVIEGFGDLIAKQSIAFDLVSERIKNQHEMIRDNNARIELVISAMAESTRQIVGIVTDIRNMQANTCEEIKTHINNSMSALNNEITKSISNVTSSFARRRTKA